MKRAVVWEAAALDDFNSAVAYIAGYNAGAAYRAATAIQKTGNQLGDYAIGRPGRVGGTYEKTVVGLPYILVYAIDVLPDEKERIVILHVIHTARNWKEGEWPR